MNNAPGIKDIDTAMLTSLVREGLNSPTAEILQWEHEPVSYINTEESNLGVHRFRGTAEDRGEVRAWSVLLKAVRAPINHTDPTYWNYHRREILAYQTGLLSDLPGGLSAPRCLGISEYAEDLCGCGLRMSRILATRPGPWLSMVWLRAIWEGSMEHTLPGILYRPCPGSVNVGCEAGWQRKSGAAWTR